MRILLGVAGSVAAYKACEVASRLTQAGHHVRVAMTRAATRFVAPRTFEALTHQPVGVDLWHGPDGALTHVTWAHDIDLYVIVPATADLLARMAEGRADDLLTAVYLGTRAPVWVVPAMESEMWTHPAVQRAARRLQDDGVRFLGPDTGRLASGATGPGRMVEPAVIVEAVRRATVPQDLSGWRVLVTAGPTWEFFDPVRLLTNPSTGAMGVAVAERARDRGASVILVHGPLRVPVPTDVDARAVVSAEEMRTACLEAFGGVDAVVATAAVSDFRPRERRAEKATKEQLALVWEMVRTPDILAELGRLKSRQIVVGFKAQTQDHIQHARAMLEAKRCDLVVANRVEDGRGFGPGETDAWLVFADGRVEPVRAAKAALADRLWDAVRALHDARNGR